MYLIGKVVLIIPIFLKPNNHFLNTIDFCFLKQVNHIPSRASNDNSLDFV